ncbi:glucuronoxylan 4-O-methyltransferase 1 [Tripterygium wilfordii]|uniref:Glucuronoxylan 4-O-methyltransferase 1 n=1 Tax=Tripterygium wilfordii TaxID=458696 RepID=A0A7J7BXR2_TRIWF|nr:probable methyltransferase At1g27930 [Tripterygium wilfordii]KAF5726663.1 glucuronoxylan 4-O-methyltransferase 1 [Tripterygium wilfordii]
MKREDLKTRLFHPERKWFLAAAITGLLVGAVLISGSIRDTDNPLFCSLASYKTRAASSYDPTPIQLKAIVHYATSRTVPQQNLAEISISLEVLKSKAPCNFLVFGLGHDSLMWESLNPRGKTLFLEEDPTWVQTVLKGAPFLRAHHVPYRTHLSEADDLRNTYRSEPNCSPNKAYLRGNEKCKLALTGMPDEVYDTEWDLIMIDAPRGYFAEAPGRMGAIFSAAVMARHRKGSGVTHVFLHDMDRRVEKMFAEEFLCRKYRVNYAGRLWHFEIPSAANVSRGVEDNSVRFC